MIRTQVFDRISTQFVKVTCILLSKGQYALIRIAFAEEIYPCKK